MSEFETTINTLNQLNQKIYKEHWDDIRLLEDEDDRYTIAIIKAISILGIFEQIRWERDVAISQLEELGLSLGQKVDGMKVININKLAKNIENKMTYMCGCRNCIETVTQIIKGERKPFDSQCDECNNEECEVKQK